MSEVTHETHVDKADAWDVMAKKNKEIAALRAQLNTARTDALEEAAEMAISNAGTWEDEDGDAGLVISAAIRALITKETE